MSKRLDAVFANGSDDAVRLAGRVKAQHSPIVCRVLFAEYILICHFSPDNDNLSAWSIPRRKTFDVFKSVSPKKATHNDVFLFAAQCSYCSNIRSQICGANIVRVMDAGVQQALGNDCGRVPLIFNYDFCGRDIARACINLFDSDHEICAELLFAHVTLKLNGFLCQALTALRLPDCQNQCNRTRDTNYKLEGSQPQHHFGAFCHTELSEQVSHRYHVVKRHLNALCRVLSMVMAELCCGCEWGLWRSQNSLQVAA